MHETIRFGNCDWLVLEKYDDRALIITKNIIEQREYHIKYTSVKWEKCALRMYLNEQFYNTFSAEDKPRILYSQTPNKDNPWFGIKGGRDTIDRIFLLSLEEVIKHLGRSKAPLTQPKRRSVESWNIDKDPYYINNSDNLARKACDTGGTERWWWLRTPGDDKKSAAIVSATGAVSGSSVHSVGGVRPALVVKL